MKLTHTLVLYALCVAYTALSQEPRVLPPLPLVLVSTGEWCVTSGVFIILPHS
jgi:hypothetical protein